MSRRRRRSTSGELMHASTRFAPPKLPQSLATAPQKSPQQQQLRGPHTNSDTSNVPICQSPHLRSSESLVYTSQRYPYHAQSWSPLYYPCHDEGFSPEIDLNFQFVQQPQLSQPSDSAFLPNSPDHALAGIPEKHQARASQLGELATLGSRFSRSGSFNSPNVYGCIGSPSLEPLAPLPSGNSFSHLITGAGTHPGVQFSPPSEPQFAASSRPYPSRIGSAINPTLSRGKRKRNCFACPKCARDQKKCDFEPGSLICQRCSKAIINPPPGICTPDSLTKAMLFRDRMDPLMIPKFGQLHTLYSHILGESFDAGLVVPTKWIDLTQSHYGGTLRLEVRPCLMTPALREQYPHYAAEYQLANPKEARMAILAFLDSNSETFVNYTIIDSDVITKAVFKAAATMAKGRPHSFVAYVLRFYRACRMIEGGWKICGDEKLGLQSNIKADIPLSNATVLDDQLATVMFDGVLQPYRVQVLQKLQEFIHKRVKKGWLISFLSVFILLKSCTLAMCHQRQFAEKHGAQQRYSCPEVVHGILDGARLLLIYFHAIKGARPFDTDWDNDEQTMKLKRQLAKDVDLPDVTFEFLKRIGPTIKARRHDFEELMKTQSFEAPYWFAGQALLPAWKPFNIVIPT